MKASVLSLSLLMVCLTATSASAQILYENGPINGEINAWTINRGFLVADTFTISGGSSTVGGLSIGAWLSAGDVLQSAEVSITEFANSGTVYFDQTVNFTQSGCFLNNFRFDVCTETSSFNGPTLNNGTYWVNLQNAVSADGNPVYWDENDGIGCHSVGCPSQADNGGLGTLGSESFTILGSSSSGGGTTPEPSSILLFGSGVIGVGVLLRRKLS